MPLPQIVRICRGCRGWTATAKLTMLPWTSMIPRVSAMNGAAQALLTAYLFTGNETYAARAALVLRAWFLDEDTAMRPNGDFMQACWVLAGG